jgi:hypothetical protein
MAANKNTAVFWDVTSSSWYIHTLNHTASHQKLVIFKCFSVLINC